MAWTDPRPRPDEFTEALMTAEVPWAPHPEPADATAAGNIGQPWPPDDPSAGLADLTTGQSVRGFCPACGHSTLRLIAGGRVHCMATDCPHPTAAYEILTDFETDHLVYLRRADFTIRHPLRERIGDALLTCDLHRWVADMDLHEWPPAGPGRYRATRGEGGWRWQPAQPDPAGDCQPPV